MVLKNSQLNHSVPILGDALEVNCFLLVAPRAFWRFAVLANATSWAFFNGIERLRKAESKGSKSSNFALQKAVAIALPLATGLRNEALSYDFGLLV